MLALTTKINCHADPDTKFPEAFSGGVRAKLEDGRELFRHIAINEGSGSRALRRETVIQKFMANATMTVSEATARRACDSILRIEELTAKEIAAMLRQDR